jgi:chaperonin GroEL
VALQHAASIASLMLTTEALISDMPEAAGAGAGAGHMPHDMG